MKPHITSELPMPLWRRSARRAAATACGCTSDAGRKGLARRVADGDDRGALQPASRQPNHLRRPDRAISVFHTLFLSSVRFPSLVQHRVWVALGGSCSCDRALGRW
jgi:hypothetical protein